MRLHILSDRGPLSAEAEAGALLARVLSDAGVPVDLPCGGAGVCGRCAVFLVDGELMSLEETLRVPNPQAPLMACRHRVTERNATVRVPSAARLSEGGQVLDQFVLPDYSLAPTVRTERAGDGGWIRRCLRAGVWDTQARVPAPPEAPIGLAVDVGTTTVAVTLLNLETGHAIGRAAGYNQQIRLAADVASRIALCADPNRVAEQQALILEETIAVLLREACDSARIHSSRIARIAIAGNTTMMHLVAGLSPLSMGFAPFTPVSLVFPERPAASLGFDVGPGAWTDLLPSASAYIGADVIADLHAARMLDGPDPALLVDIGTNGEIVLLNRGRLFGCATAAGPAFEGAGLACGCRAVPGAVDHVAFDPSGTLAFSTIQGHPPVGICGTAIVDFLAEGRRTGWLNEMGRMDLDRLKQWGRYFAVPSGEHWIHACRFAGRSSEDGGDIYLSEADVAQALKAKAAIQAGIATLLEREGLAASDVRRVVVAGGFGRYIRLENAVAMGLLPRVPLDRVEWIGNGSLAGACLALLDETALGDMARLANAIEIVELNREKSFEMHYIESLMLPDEPVEKPERHS